MERAKKVRAPGVSSSVPRNALVATKLSTTTDWPETGLWEVKGMFPVRLGIVGQLCVLFVCRSSSGSTGDGDRTSRLTVG
jgi:hypothetical protein